MDSKKEKRLQVKSELKSLDQLTFDEKTVQLIKDTIAVGATDNELQLFLYQAKRTGLDPINRQIFFIKRGDKVNIQTSIDGFRIIAERHGDYAGQDEPEFIYDNNHKLNVAKVRVYKWRGDQRYLAATGVAHMSEYMPMQGAFMWTKMPHTMLAKVAEALALRKAFPQDLSGIYSDDEMAQAQPNAPVNIPAMSTKEQHATIYELANSLGHSKIDTDEIVSKYYKVKNVESLNKRQAELLIKSLEDKLKDISEKDEIPAEEIVDADEVDKALNEDKEEKCEVCGDVNGYHKKPCPNNVKTADGDSLPLKEVIH